MNLRKMLIRVIETYGLVHVANLAAVRQYLKVTPEETVIKEIKSLETVPQLRALWEAGLRQPYMDLAISRIKEFEGR